MILKNFSPIERSKKQLATLAMASALCVGGCAQWGANVLEENHVAFNTAVCQAMDSQMLLNIVRMSMEEPTQWMMATLSGALPFLSSIWPPVGPVALFNRSNSSPV